MNTICTTCGTTLQSDISREYGQCGACRAARESAEDRQTGREPGDPRKSAPDQDGRTIKPH